MPIDGPLLRQFERRNFGQIENIGEPRAVRAELQAGVMVDAEVPHGMGPQR